MGILSYDTTDLVFLVFYPFDMSYKSAQPSFKSKASPLI